MKRLTLTAVTALLLLPAGYSYADTIRITAINESGRSVNLKFASPRNRIVPLGSADVKLFSAEYNYPEAIYIQGRGQYQKPCDWTMPRVGKQVITGITMNINTDKSTNAQTCLLTGNT